MIFCVFALRSLKALRLIVVGSLLNFCKAALCKQITVLQSLLNQGVLCLFDAIGMRISVKCFGLLTVSVYRWFQRFASLLCYFPVRESIFMERS